MNIKKIRKCSNISYLSFPLLYSLKNIILRSIKKTEIYTGYILYYRFIY